MLIIGNLRNVTYIKKMAGTRLRKQAFLKAFADSMGNITIACKSVGISRRAYYDWISKDAKFKEECDIVNESAIDFVENKLLSRINDNDTTAIIFYLKTKGKNRGYVEKVEQDVTVNAFERLMQELPDDEG